MLCKCKHYLNFFQVYIYNFHKSTQNIYVNKAFLFLSSNSFNFLFYIVFEITFKPTLLHSMPLGNYQCEFFLIFSVMTAVYQINSEHLHPVYQVCSTYKDLKIEKNIIKLKLMLNMVRYFRLLRLLFFGINCCPFTGVLFVSTDVFLLCTFCLLTKYILSFYRVLFLQMYFWVIMLLVYM